MRGKIQAFIAGMEAIKKSQYYIKILYLACLSGRVR